ncbi:MAG: acyl-CoA dehydrogenase family protein [Planctomycetes bacterium]|nr:acyl-CoA dehydrogenase family protein [Planctomycetota bacterium]HPF15049.1 acyl-CoA dehydrogenase family protein [Planctomycetota bacterium]HRV79991.1 acyl-CoA dehydrogenase family protein [Planctomycetota bacterium]
MDFALSEELSMVRDMSRDFAENHLMPLATQHDREAKIDASVFPAMAELGLWGLTVPESYGGAGMSNLAMCLVLEEINRACASTGVTLSVHASLVCAPINKWGTEAQKQAWLPKLASGEVLGAYSLSEAVSGSDAAALVATGTRDGNDWVLNGTKLWVTTGEQAGLFVVYVRTDPTVSKAKGITAFLLPRDTPGFQVGKKEKKTGIRGSSTNELVLNNVRLGPESVLGEVGRGFNIAMDTLDGGRIGIASQAVGIGRACLEAATKYAKEREQFGQAIANFQAVQWKLADMSTHLDAARFLVHNAAWLRDTGQEVGRMASQAKLMASKTANFCADECLQIHGGAGYTDDFHVERLFRDARITEIYEGATDVQRIVIARHLLRS